MHEAQDQVRFLNSEPSIPNPHRPSMTCPNHRNTARRTCADTTGGATNICRSAQLDRVRKYATRGADKRNRTSGAPAHKSSTPFVPQRGIQKKKRPASLTGAGACPRSRSEAVWRTRPEAVRMACSRWTRSIRSSLRLAAPPRITTPNSGAAGRDTVRI